MKVINSKSVGNRGQQVMGMSFSMIFAILLIVTFIAFAFVAIGGFLDIGRSSSVGMFYDELQGAVNNVWGSQYSESAFEINLPSEITQVCFADLSMPITNRGPEYEMIKDYYVYDANTFLLPPEYAQNMQWKLIDNINVTKITQYSNPYCVDVASGLKISKGFYDQLVLIE